MIAASTFGGRLVRRYVIYLLSLFSYLPVTHAQGVATQSTKCTPIASQFVQPLPKWDDDANYTLRESKSAVGSRLYYVGDILHITSQLFTQIIKEMNAAPTNIRQITFDAREIIIEGPLSLSSARIEFVGQRVIIGQGARITLTAPPFADQPDGVSIITQSLEFNHAYPVPLQFQLASGVSRSIKLVAEAVRANGKPIQANAIERFLRRKTLTGMYEIGNFDTSNWTVTTGTAAHKEFMTEFAESMTWPRYTVSKLLKYHSRDPYGDGNGDELKRRINQLYPLIQNWSGPDVILDLNRLIARMEAHVDDFGHSAEYAPRIALSDQIDSLDGDITSESQYLDGLASLVSEAYESTKLDQEQLKSIQDKLADTSSQITSINLDIDSLKQQQQELNDKHISLKRLITQTQSDIAYSVSEQNNNRKKAADIQAGVALGAEAVGVAASIVAGPEVGAGVAAGVSGLGKLVYANNSGGVTLQSVGDALNTADQYYSGMKKVFDNWSKYTADQKMAIQVIDGDKVERKDSTTGKTHVVSKGEAARQWGSDLKSLYDSFYPFYDKLHPQASTPINLTDAEKNDAELGALLTQLAAAQQQGGEILDKVKVDLDSQVTAKETQEKEVATLKQLVDVPARNDADYERWRASALELWHYEISSLIQNVYVLRRAYTYSTGSEIVLPSDAAGYFSELQAATMTGTYDPLFATPGDPSAADIQKALKREREKITSVLTATVKAAKDGYRFYLDNGSTQPHTFRETYRAFDAGNYPKFIDAINAQIEVQLLWKADVRHLTPIPIPLDLPVRPTSGPERLVQAKITSVDFSQGETPAEGLTFYIDDPGYGTVEWANGTCSIVDMRTTVPGAVDNVFATPIGSIDPNWAREAPSEIDPAKKGSFYAYYPTHTNLLLWVQIDSNQIWPTLPQIKSLVISMEILK
jgi:hypothetical protein